MINIRTIKKLKENEGLTLKKGKIINYKTGYQVATEGIETKDPNEAIKAVRSYKGDCGLWLSKGVYYVDKSKRISTKKQALTIGRACRQISIFDWSKKDLIYC